jgi:hypothetical protein
MDGLRFDAISRSFGRRIDRRRLLRGAGGASAAAGIAGLVAPAAAQEATPVPASPSPGEPCTVPFEATVRTGPDAGLSLIGFLALNPGPGGAIDQGSFVLDDGRELPVVGQVTGRAVNLMITVADGQVIFGVGTLENDLSVCAGQMGGPLVGPQPGDQGDWGTLLGSRPLNGESACVRCIKACENAGGKKCSTNCKGQGFCD